MALGGTSLDTVSVVQLDAHLELIQAIDSFVMLPKLRIPQNSRMRLDFVQFHVLVPRK